MVHSFFFFFSIEENEMYEYDKLDSSFTCQVYELLSLFWWFLVWIWQMQEVTLSFNIRT